MKNIFNSDLLLCWTKNVEIHIKKGPFASLHSQRIVYFQLLLINTIAQLSLQYLNGKCKEG